MAFKAQIFPYTLGFKRPAGTSRGVYHDHPIWYVVLEDISNPEYWGIGECAPLFDLSCDYGANYPQVLQQFCQKLQTDGTLDKEALRAYPSMLFGLETALRHYERQSFKLWDSAFANGQQGIAINGLIWMGEPAYMLSQIEEKLTQGFRCIKLKIGAIDFEEELKLLKYIRSHFSARDVTLRVDANGAFAPTGALDKLKRLAEFDLHSIEQPVAPKQWDVMASLVDKTPLPIALDEELIGVHQLSDKKHMLEVIKPQYIILKPTLHGGFAGCQEWIALAQAMHIGWWATSALESNIGLNAISQWCATLHNTLPQGLGTGSLYTNNIKMPLYIQGDCLWFEPEGAFFSRDGLM